MDNGNIGDWTDTKCCKHVNGVAFWVKNDGEGPPVVMWTSYGGYQVVLTLTNQTIYARCLACYNIIRASATKLTPAP